MTDEVRPAPPPRLPVPPPGRPVPSGASRRPPLWWFVGLGAVLLLSVLPGDPAAPPALGGLYLLLTGGWALLRRGSSLRAVGRRGLAGLAVVGAVLFVTGSAIAAAPATDRPAVSTEPSDPATLRPTTEPTGPAPTAAPTPTHEPGNAPTPSAPTPSAPATQTPEQTDAAARSALEVARTLEVKGRAPRTGYDRDLFGSGWVDTDRNGCDTRNDILARDLVEITYRPGTRDCVVASGVLHDPYSGQTIRFVRGNDTSNAVQIDHVVALSDAWQKGAQQWDEATRVRFGNDPLNLLAVDGPLNQQKGDGDAATWLPPNRAYRCPYVARQVAVKDAYGLWVTQAEQDAMVRVLSSCPDEPLPTAQSPTATSVPASPAAPAVPTTPPPASPAAPVDTPFRNCSEARAAGAAPVHRGDPGYGPHLDRDGDGIGCE